MVLGDQRQLVLLCCAVLFAMGCGRLRFEPIRDGAMMSDAGDAGADADVDAGLDAGVDAGADAGLDAGVDAGADAGLDAGVDAGLDAGVDAGLDAGVDAGCTWTAFGAPEKLTGFNVTGDLWGSALSADGLTLYFALGLGQLRMATRPDRGTVFSPAVVVPNVDSPQNEGTPSVSADGLLLYFFSERPGGMGSTDIWVATRGSLLDDFGAPSLAVELNTPGLDYLPRLSADGLMLSFTSNRAGGVGGEDVWLATRASTADAFSNITNWSEVNTTAADLGASMSSDGLLLIFSSNRPGGLGGKDLWTASRVSVSAPFEPAINLAVGNTPNDDADVSLSRDDREIIYSASVNGTRDLWRLWRDCL